MIPAGARVYVVDDDPSFVRSALRLLASWSVAATGFTSGRAFLDQLDGVAPACVLLDLRMPELSGLEIQAELALSERRLPVVFMSGHADVQAGIDALMLGAIDFVAKPVDEARLLAALERALAADVRARAERVRSTEARALLALLGEQQRRICQLVLTGLPDAGIAEALGSTEAAVHATRVEAMERLGVVSLVELVRVIEAAGC
jgi:FixJ family two-component response regulator